MYIKKSKVDKRSSGAIAVISCLALLVLSAVVLQASDIDLMTDQYGTIMGTVSDAETESSIEGALVILTYHETVRSTLTDSQGKYSFSEVPNCFCLKNVSAHMKGYASQYKMVAVQKITYVDFQLEQEEGNGEPTGGTITGIVTDAITGLPIPDALMTLKYHEVVRTQKTDSNGRYTFTEVPICFCLKNVSAEKEGYEDQYEMVAVSEITYVNFSLEPAGSNEPNSGVPVDRADEMEAFTNPDVMGLGVMGMVIAIFTVLVCLIFLKSFKILIW